MGNTASLAKSVGTGSEKGFSVKLVRFVSEVMILGQGRSQIGVSAPGPAHLEKVLSMFYYSTGPYAGLVEIVLGKGRCFVTGHNIQYIVPDDSEEGQETQSA